MLLKHKKTGALVEACTLTELTDPCTTQVLVKNLKGYRAAEPTLVDKAMLVFVSGENLPNCWMKILAHSNPGLTAQPLGAARMRQKGGQGVY